MSGCGCENCCREYVDALDAAVRDADTLAEALRPFAEEWDFHAADYLAHDAELRVIEASTIERITAAIDNARALLASRAAGQEQATTAPTYSQPNDTSGVPAHAEPPRDR